MTEEKFTELVNLYLDKEISERGIAQLNCELAANVERKDEFAEHCRMHQAMCMALNSQSSKRRFKSLYTGSSSSSRSSHSSQRGQRTFPNMSPRVESFSTRETNINHSAHEVTTFSRWIMGIGFAASLALGFVLLMPVFRDTSAVSSQPAPRVVEAGELVETDALDRIGQREIRRFANAQFQREVNQRASLASQFRLMGLSSELTPEEKQLRSFTTAAAQRPEVVRDHAELVAEIQKISAMPLPQILRIESMQSEPTVSWSGGFKSSLASFK
jgi:hypothetical protein